MPSTGCASFLLRSTHFCLTRYHNSAISNGSCCGGHVIFQTRQLGELPKRESNPLPSARLERALALSHHRGSIIYSIWSDVRLWNYEVEEAVWFGRLRDREAVLVQGLKTHPISQHREICRHKSRRIIFNLFFSRNLSRIQKI